MPAPYTVNSGTLVSTNDAVSLAISGLDYATARVVISVAGSGGITFQYSIDGTNWLSSAYAKRLDAVNANPSVAPWVNNTPIVATFEIPLPGNCTNFRVLYATGGTATTLSITGGAPYFPGLPVVATLFDVLSVTNTLNSTGVLDLSGWGTYYAEFSAGGATTVALVGTDIADDGFVVAQATPAAYSAGGGRTLVATATSGIYVASRFVPTATNAAIPTRRMAFSLAATAAQQTRLRIEAYR